MPTRIGCSMAIPLHQCSAQSIGHLVLQASLEQLQRRSGVMEQKYDASPVLLGCAGGFRFTHYCENSFVRCDRVSQFWSFCQGDTCSSSKKERFPRVCSTSAPQA